MKSLNAIDRFLIECDKALRVSFAESPKTARSYPVDQKRDNGSGEYDLNESEKQLSASLMRINHAGEISAQGLYQGQALTAKNKAVKAQMQTAAEEEEDHLYWCEKRLQELNSHKSYLSPLWYIGSFSIGAVAGLLGDKWSMGFVKETEEQVVRHLDSHLQQLPEKDIASRQIVTQMREDELQHAKLAQASGAAELPPPIRKGLMPFLSSVMVSVAGRF